MAWMRGGKKRHSCESTVNCRGRIKMSVSTRCVFQNKNCLKNVFNGFFDHLWPCGCTEITVKETGVLKTIWPRLGVSITSQPQRWFDPFKVSNSSFQKCFAHKTLLTCSDIVIFVCVLLCASSMCIYVKLVPFWPFGSLHKVFYFDSLCCFCVWPMSSSICSFYDWCGIRQKWNSKVYPEEQSGESCFWDAALLVGLQTLSTDVFSCSSCGAPGPWRSCAQCNLDKRVQSFCWNLYHDLHLT